MVVNWKEVTVFFFSIIFQITTTFPGNGEFSQNAVFVMLYYTFQQCFCLLRKVDNYRDENKFSDNFQRPLAIPHVNSIIISLAIEALILE